MVPVIPTRPPQVAQPAYRRKKLPKIHGLLLLVAGIGSMAMISSAIPDKNSRFGWVETDFYQFQGNYAGLISKNGKSYILVRNSETLRSFELNDECSFSQIPQLGGLIEVHYTGKKYPKVLRDADIRPLYLESEEPGEEHLPTRYRTF